MKVFGGNNETQLLQNTPYPHINSFIINCRAFKKELVKLKKDPNNVELLKELKSEIKSLLNINI